jgi:aerobic carbon-monoxide dehydrogenase medium subunit
MYAFDYQRPTSRDAAKAAATGADTRYLAGGQSLIQAMRLRLSQSERLVDLGAVADLKGIKAENGGVTIGAMATHASVAANADVKRLLPALAELAGGIGDPMVRNMGTIGGSIANADPAACYPTAVLALGATIHTDRRTILADDFFTGLYETALQPGELITAVSFPPAQKAAYVKYRQQASRFALIGVFVAQTAAGVRVAVTGAKGNVFRATEIETALAKSFTAAAAKAVKMPTTGINADLHGSAEYRAAMISVIASRAVDAALAR